MPLFEKEEKEKVVHLYEIAKALMNVFQTKHFDVWDPDNVILTKNKGFDITSGDHIGMRIRDFWQKFQDELLKLREK